MGIMAFLWWAQWVMWAVAVGIVVYVKMKEANSKG